MAMFYSAQKQCFSNDSGLESSVEISDEQYAELLAKLASGQTLSSDENGYPVALPIAPETPEALREKMVMTAGQARLRLKAAGHLAAVEGAIKALPLDADGTDPEIRILWLSEPYFHRTNAALDSFCKNALGMSDEQIDGLFS
jgi:hypothetical protein